MAVAVGRSYLCHFAQEQLNFRLNEFETVSKAMKCSLLYKDGDYSNKSPFFVFSAESEESVLKILKRSILTKYIYELWGHGKSYDELKSSLFQLPEYVHEFCERRDYSFCLKVKGYNKKLSASYQKDRIEWLSFLPINGQVDLSNPNHEFYLLEDYGDNPNQAPDRPLRIYFGRLVGEGQRHLINQYSLKTRYFIGNTSMDPQLAIIMANMAQVKPSSLVFDPFAGTGSVLVGCAHFGGYVMGGDIDWPLLHGRGKVSRSDSKKQWRGKDDNVRACLKQYGLENQYIDMLVTDASRSVWRENELFDAIVADPPYGVREGSRKVGKHKERHHKEPTALSEENQEIDQQRYPSMCSYHTFDVFTDLVGFAAKNLVVGGHLVYWLPVIREEYNESSLPSHPCLKLVASCEQPLLRDVSRYLVTMCKTVPWTHQEFNDFTKEPVSSLLEDFREKYFAVSK